MDPMNGKVTQCLLSIPHSPSIANSTLDTVQAALELYSFKDISRSSPNPVYLPVSVDLDSGILRIRSKTYPNDYTFQQDLADLINAFKDAHTRYSKPTCHSIFTYTLNFTIASVRRDGIQKIIINDRSSVYDGRTILAIDGRDPVDTIKNFSSSVCRDSLDLSTRFTDGLKVFTRRTMRYFAIPNAEFAQFEIDGVGNINFPWIVQAGMTIKSLDDMISLCKAKPLDIRNGSIPFIDYLDDQRGDFSNGETKLGRHRSALARHIRELHSRYSNLPMKHFSRHESFHGEAQSYHKPEHVDSHVFVNHVDKTDFKPGEVIYSSKNMLFTFVKSGVAALRIPSFLPSEFGLDTIYSIKSIPQFLFDMQRVYVMAYDLKIKDLIMDLRGNGGGWICLAMEILRILFPVPQGQQPQGELFDIRSSPLLVEIANNAAKLPRDVYSIFSPWKFFSPDTFQPYNDTTWLIPNIMYTRGGVNHGYSKMVTDDCTMVDIPSWNPKFLFSPDNFLILSDGTCGSACALVARNLQENRQAKVLVVGGIDGRSQMVASFIGGLVYDLPTLLEELKLLNLLDSPFAPKPFLTSADLRFTLWEQYPWAGISKPPIPSEFVFQASDYRMLYTDVSLNNNLALYLDAFNLWKRS